MREKLNSFAESPLGRWLGCGRHCGGEFTYNARLSRSAWLNMMVSNNPECKKQNEAREKRKAELRAQGIDPDETSSLTSQGHHGFESDNKPLTF